MDLSRSEKLFLIVLSILLLVGSVILHTGHLRSYHKSTTTEHLINEEVTLKEMETLLREKRKVNINTATANELLSIPGVGETLALRIVGYRNTQGDFYDKDNLLKLKGIGNKKFEKIKEYIKL